MTKELPDWAFDEVKPAEPIRQPISEYCGVGIWIDRGLPSGTVQLRDADGNTIGTIYNIGAIHIGSRG